MNIFRRIKIWWDNYWIEYEKWWDGLTPEEKMWIIMLNQRNRFL